MAGVASHYDDGERLVLRQRRFGRLADRYNLPTLR